MNCRNFKILIAVLLFFGWSSCSYNDSSFDGAMSEGSGTGGSMARFTIVGDRLFTVDHETLNVYDVSSAENPEYKQKSQIGFGVETIFPFGENLFLGTNSGMYIYKIRENGIPEKISFYEHVVACDPVVSDGRYAYVTLSSGRPDCWRPVNELQIIDLADLSRPKLVKQYPMSNPRGLAVRNDTVWLCDGGLRILDVSDKSLQNVKELHYFNDLIAYDIILDRNRALVIGESGFVQYKLENDAIRKLSEIKVEY